MTRHCLFVKNVSIPGYVSLQKDHKRSSSKFIPDDEQFIVPLTSQITSSSITF